MAVFSKLWYNNLSVLRKLKCREWALGRFCDAESESTTVNDCSTKSHRPGKAPVHPDKREMWDPILRRLLVFASIVNGPTVVCSRVINKSNCGLVPQSAPNRDWWNHPYRSVLNAEIRHNQGHGRPKTSHSRFHPEIESILRRYAI